MSRTSKATTKYLKTCRERVDASRKWRQKEGYDALWSRMIDLYAGKQFDYDAMGDEDRITVNISFASVNVIFPSVSVANPKFVVTAQTAESENTAIIAEAVLNHDWRRYRYQSEFRQMVKDFIIIGHGWGKTGYRYKEVEEARDPADVEAEANQRYAEVNDAIAENPEMANMMPNDDEIAASIPATHTVVAEDRSFMERVSPFDMFVDPTATGLNDLRWVAQRIITPLETAKADKRFKDATRKKLTATTTASSTFADDTASKRFGQDNSDEQYTTIWEFYDLTDGIMCVFADGCEGYLADPISLPYAFGHPFEMLRNYDVPDHFYPMGDLEQVEQLQQELNLTRSQAMNDRKRWRRKYLVNEDAFDKEGMNALESVEENVLVPVRKGVPFGEAVTPMPFTPLPPEFYDMSEHIKSDMNEVMAISEYARGSLPNIRRTATEASVINDAATARASEKLSLIEDGLARLGTKLIQLAQQYMTGQQILHVIGPSGGELWAHYDRTYIAGEFDFLVEAGSTQPNNESMRRQSAMQLMDAMSQFIPLNVVNVPELMRYVLQKGFGIKAPERFIQQPPPPMPMGPGGQPPPQQGALPPGEQLPPLPEQPTEADVPPGSETGWGNQYLTSPMGTGQ